MRASWGLKSLGDIEWNGLILPWVGWTVSAVVCMIPLMIAVYVALFLLEVPGQASLLERLLNWLLLGPAGVVPGTLTAAEGLAMALSMGVIAAAFGAVQRVHLGIHDLEVRRWVLATGVSGALGVPVLALLGAAAGHLGYALSWGLLAPLSASLIALVQWMGLRHSVSEGRWYMPAVSPRLMGGSEIFHLPIEYTAWLGPIVALVWLLPLRSPLFVLPLALGPLAGLVVCALLSARKVVPRASQRSEE